MNTARTGGRELHLGQGPRVVATVVVVTAVALATARFLPGDSHHHARESGAGHHADIGDLPDGIKALGLPLGFKNDPAGQRGSGGRAVAHHEGGRRITNLRVTRRAPDARITYVDGLLGLEPTLGVNEQGHLFYVAAQAGPFKSIIGRSVDGGVTWQDVSPVAHQTTQDPYVWVDKSTGRVFDVDFAAGLQVSTSDDEGETWTSSTVPQSWNSDHQNLFAGPPPQGAPKPVGYPHVVYLCSIGGGALAGYGTATTCTRSFDGGLTFTPSREPAFLDGQNEDPGHFGISGHCGGETGHGFVDRKGFVYLARGWCGQPWLAISKDAGQSWTRVQVAKTGMPESPGGLQEHEAGVVADGAGNVYVVWTGRDRLPYLAISRNGGKSFGRAMMIGPPGLRESSLPTIDVGDNGRLAIAYIGSTNAPGGESPTGEARNTKTRHGTATSPLRPARWTGGRSSTRRTSTSRATRWSKAGVRSFDVSSSSTSSMS